MNTNEASLLQRAINTSATANAKADVAVSELLTVHRDLGALITLLHGKGVLTDADIHTIIPGLAELQLRLAAALPRTLAEPQQTSLDTPRPPLGKKKVQ